jgi:hypothetical protein
MEEQKQSTELVRIVKESGLEESKAQTLLTKFSNFFELAADWDKKSKAIIVTDISQVAEMKMAREGRIFLKQKRNEVENTRKELKEQSLREGKAIDGISNVLKALIIPIEDYLEQQEKFAEIQEANQREALKQTRTNELLKYDWIDTGMYDLGKLTDDLYNFLLAGIEKAYNDRIEAAQKIEAERLAKEKADQEERERIKSDNERLQKEAEAREKAMAEERKAQAAKLAEEQAKAKKEAEAREKVEKELQAKKDADLKAQKDAEAKAAADLKAKQDADKKAAAAPDKEKLLSIIDGMQFPALSLTTAYGQATEKVIREKFEGFREWAKKTINTQENSLGL